MAEVNSKSLTIGKRLELIFSQAAALSQTNRFKSKIYLLPGEVFLTNMDGTALFRFDAAEVKNSFGFAADDYDSSSIRVSSEGVVSFIMESGEWEREKSKPSLDMEVANMLKKRWGNIRNEKTFLRFSFHKNHLSLLSDRLSHLEIGVVKGRLFFLQRDIYSGSMTRVWENGSKEGLLKSIRPDMSPIAIRTSDFISLFAFRNNIQVSLHPLWAFCTSIENPKMEAILGACFFGEMDVNE